LFAKHFWPGENAIGKRYYHGGDTSSTRFVTVIGIVPNIKHTGLTETGDLQTYEAFDQVTQWTNYVVVRSTTPPESIAGEMRRTLASLDRTLPFYEVRSMRDALDRSIGIRKLTDRLLLGFSIIAALLAAIGIYGVMSLNVAGRLREFGVRVALGATGSSVMSLVVRRGMILAGAGVVTGLLGALWLTRFISTMLFGVGRFDVVTFVAVSGMLVMVALVACALPAWRATRTDPMKVLRSD
jgi:putative ABC transport system permease protein